MNAVHLDAVGLAGPGLGSWPESIAMLAGDDRYRGGDGPACVPQLLPPNERRRVSSTVRLALKVAEEAMARASVDIDQVCSVFATCDGDTEILDRICVALTQAERPVSPTQFHNSVHNAAAGYWAIATRAPTPSTTVSAYRASFVAGLMEATAQIRVEGRPVLLVAYDHPVPVPLAAFAGTYDAFAVALLMCPQATAQSTPLQIEIVSGQSLGSMRCDDLERLRLSNPAACALPLLAALASDAPGRVVLPHVSDLQLAVDVGAR